MNILKLNDIPYKRYTYEKYYSEFNNMINQFKLSNSWQEQLNIHQNYCTFINSVTTSISLANLKYNHNIKNPFFIEEINYYNKMKPLMYNIETQYQTLFTNSKYKNFFKKYLGTIAFQNIQLQQKVFNNKIIPLKQEENILITKYNKMISSLQIKYNNTNYSINNFQKLLKVNHQNERINAQNARSHAFEYIADELDNIFDQLMICRVKQAEILGFDSYIDMAYATLGRCSFTPENIKNFRNNIFTNLIPSITLLNNIRKERLNLKILHYADEGIYYKTGNPKPIIEPTNILPTLNQLFKNISTETESYSSYMLNNDLYDIEILENKRKTSYTDFLYKYKYPVIFTNYNNTYTNINTLIHESGHAFQYFLTKDDPIMEHNLFSKEIAETHAISFEFFSEKYINLFFGNKDFEYKQCHFEKTMNDIAYSCMIDEFQEIIYSNINMSAKSRKDIWKMLESKYRPHIKIYDDFLSSSGSIWQLQKHIYNTPFYYIDYGLAKVCALQFKNMIQNDYKKAWNHYISFCRQSGKDSFINTIQTVGLNNPFKLNSILTIKNMITSQYNNI